jgi:hypothetical protein
MMVSLARTYARIAALPIMLAVTGCGTMVPSQTEVWETREIDNDMAFRIKRSIFCELIAAIRSTNEFYDATSNSPDVIPPDYGVQLQTTLTVEESTALNPSLTYNRTLANTSVMGATVGQMFNLGVGATASSTATRVDTGYSYYVIEKIAAKGKNKNFCADLADPTSRAGSSPLLKSDLGIETFLRNAVKAAVVLHSSVPGTGKKDAKLDVYSYEVKFAVITNGSVNPVWKLVNVSADTGSLPLVNAGRTRTHDLLITFGPNSSKGFEPSLVALQQHFTAQGLRTPIPNQQ